MQVNRGGGILHAFYARNSYVPTNQKKPNKIINIHDYEQQNVKILTRKELLDIIINKQEIGEAQWLATIATAMLYDDYPNANAQDVKP